MATIASLIEQVDRPGVDSDPALDVRTMMPEVTREEALRVQLGVKRRRVAAGDQIVGHQASFTTAAVRETFPDAPYPMVGTLLRSVLRCDGDEVALDADKSLIECEIGIVLKDDLNGADLTRQQVLRAIDSFVPAIEIAPLRPGILDKAYSYEHSIAVQKAAGGYVVLGSRHTSPRDIDVALEGFVVSVDGERLAGGVGFDAMHHPLNVVAAIAANLYQIGEKLIAGQVIITGALPAPPRATRANKSARAELTNLGSVTVRFT